MILFVVTVISSLFQVLLDLARTIFEEQSTLHNIVQKIMMITQTLLQCERCSVLLVDPTSKVSMVIDRKVRVYIATKLFQFASRKSYANLTGSDGFFRPCLRHCVRPSYRDFLDSFVIKARVGR